MIQARVNVFETNSSSTHNCTIMTDKNYKAFLDGDLYINKGWIGSESEFTDNDFVTREQIVDIYEKAKNENYRKYAKYLKLYINNDDGSFDEYLSDNNFMGYFTSSSYWGNELETDVTKFTTEHGDTIVVLCEYGYDG